MSHLPRHRPCAIRVPFAGIHVGEIIGWRAWRVVDCLLMSMTANYVWPWHRLAEGNVDREVSVSGSRRYIPTGIYAFKSSVHAHDLAAYEAGPFFAVYGRVALWGEVVEHERGYRAQYARVLSIDGIASHGGEAPGYIADTLGALQRRYGIDGSFD